MQFTESEVRKIMKDEIETRFKLCDQRIEAIEGSMELIPKMAKTVDSIHTKLTGDDINTGIIDAVADNTRWRKQQEVKPAIDRKTVIAIVVVFLIFLSSLAGVDPDNNLLFKMFKSIF